MTTNDLHELAASLSAEEWSELVVASADPNVADPRLPSLPPEMIQRITNGLSGEETLRAAAGIYSTIHDIVGRHVAKDAPMVLDFGCGWGRLTRFLPQLTVLQRIYGVDVDQRLIRWSRARLSPMKFKLIGSGKRMPFRDSCFDLVISRSVFSHLSRDTHLFHVNDIARVLRPGGLFIGTTLSRPAMERMYGMNTEWITGVTGPQEEAEAAVERDGFVFGASKRWDNYGIAFATDEWIRQNWQPAFDIVEVVDGDQQTYVARRRPDGTPRRRASARGTRTRRKVSV